MAGVIDTDVLSARYRAAAIKVAERRLLVSRLKGSAQEQDLTVPPNCDGFGRIRHFRRKTSAGWPENPLPIDPATRSLRLPRADALRAQVFQNAVCNWRCWYCYVPFDLLSAKLEFSDWKTPAELVDLYLREENRPEMIDLSGGQPDLVPEWVPWTMEALRERGVADRTFLWSDDNLSNDFFWRYLSDDQLEQIRSYPHYAKVGCFKGFDSESFAFNTRAAPELFDRQFELFGRYLDLGLSLYAYATLTAPNAIDVPAKVRRFVDRLQALHPNLPLRTIPLEIATHFRVVNARPHHPPDVLRSQQEAIAAWQDEIASRFSSEMRTRAIVEVQLSLRPSQGLQSNQAATMPRAKPASKLSTHSTAADAVALLRSRLRDVPFWSERLAAVQASPKNVRVHLAIFTEPYLQFVLDGTKTVESRFSVHRCAPFERADEGDIVLLKESGGGVIGICQITSKWFYHLDKSAWAVIKQQFGRPLAIRDGAFWKQKERASYASLFKIEHVHRLERVPVAKRDRRGWVILNKGET